MRRKLLGVILAVCIGWFQAEAGTDAAIMTKPEYLNFVNQTSATLSCNLTNPSSAIKGSYWTHNGKTIEKSHSKTGESFIEHKISKIDYHSSGIYACVFETEPKVNATIEVKVAPHVAAYKHSENANEKDKAVLICVSHGYPLPTDWKWYKLSEINFEKMNLTNGTENYEIKSTANKTTLYVKDLEIDRDMGMYECLGINDIGQASDKIQLRVRSQLAALWPFLGIVAEVIILITVIFIYEKRRKPDEINDDDDSGSAPLKSNAATNHKDKNVRQRNSN